MRRPPALAASNAAAWAMGSGNDASGPARSQPVKPWSRKRAAVSASVTLASGSCERSAVAIEPDDRPVPMRRVLGAAADRCDPVGQGEPAGDVEQRSPADLEVADAVGRLRLDQLGRDPLERLGVLHQRDRQVERAQQLGLVGARHRRDQRRAHPAPNRAAHRPRASVPARAPCRSGASHRGGDGARPWASPRPGAAAGDR